MTPMRFRNASVATEQVNNRIERAAPPPPPCFDDRAQWVAWLQVALVASDKGINPLLYRRGKNGAEKATAFNHKVDYCQDCTAAYRTEMQLQERCNPRFVADWPEAE